MTANDPVRVEGLSELVRALRAAENSLDDLKTANQTASRIVLDAARVAAPRRTGRLAASGRVNRAAKKANVMFGNARVPYAQPIHWGWAARDIEAQPFVTTAAERTRPAWVAAYEHELQQIISAI